METQNRFFKQGEYYIFIAKMINILVVLLFLVGLISSQSCLNPIGEPVAWWVIIKVPPKTGHSGYGYYDEHMRTGQFIYNFLQVDKGSTPLTHTFNMINSQKMQLVAWNDEKPTGEVNSSCAHSKGLMAYNLPAQKGLLLTHSIPKFPSIVNGHVDPTISASQNIYGQNLACFSMTIKQLDDIAQMMLITMPFMYGGTATDTSATRNIYKLSTSQFITSSVAFNKHEFRSPFGYNLKTIYKNDKVNSSIFEDGLTQYLVVSPLIAETWGRPIQAPWCSGRYKVYNVQTLLLGGISWSEQDDHAKWVIANNEYGCMGDMNRMTSQWKRGGSFFCLSDSNLVSALKRIITTHDSC